MFHSLLDFDYLCRQVIRIRFLGVCDKWEYVMDVDKYKIKWWQWVLYIVVSAGLLYITKSWMMSLGIILLLILLDRWLAEYERKKRGGDEDDILL